MVTFLPASEAGNVKCLRYHPVPPTTKPVLAPPALCAESNGLGGAPLVDGKSSMLQSCGKSSMRHALSSKPGISAPVASARKKRQQESKGVSRLVAKRSAPHAFTQAATRTRNATGIVRTNLMVVCFIKFSD